ncbi:MAG: DUF4389 domain-containing protein [Ilumatobacteraceae bacterium]|nr:DUF4389 domain-containing protein [Ilumatobacteraceae bacterium]
MSETSGTNLPPPGGPPPPPVAAGGTPYAARVDVDYVDDRNRVTVAFRIILIIPIAIILNLLVGNIGTWVQTSGGSWVYISASIGGALFAATLLMLLFRQRYPRWWFDFLLELSRFAFRVGAYLVLLTDKYPSTVDAQDVELELDYPDAERDISRWMPLVKWFILIPHYIVLFFLAIGAYFVVIFSWFAILFTGRIPRGAFDYILGVGRWGLRVHAYGFLLITDEYPPFSLR